MIRSVSLLSTLAVLLFGLQPEAQQLIPTSHPPVSRDLAALWLVPGQDRPRATSPIVDGMTLVDEGQSARALKLLSGAEASQEPLAEYAMYYAALAERDLGQMEAARDRFARLSARQPSGFLAEAAAIGEAAAHEALGDPEKAVEIYERLRSQKLAAPDDLLVRLAGAAKAAGDVRKSAETLGHLYFEYPQSPLAAAAGAEYDATDGVQRLAAGNQRYKLELGRAERLFGARQYTQARLAFERLRLFAAGDDRDLVRLRLGEIDYFLRRYRTARDLLRAEPDKIERRGEALYYYAVTLRVLGAHPEYLKTIRRVISEFPTERWAEDALNDLATHFILVDDDAQADVIFRELLEKYPKGRHAERAGWKIGWRAYREGRYAETVKYFDTAAAVFPRSDYRPSWIYWSGRSYEALKQPRRASEMFLLAVTDYQNSYYGRLASGRLGGRRPAARLSSEEAPVVATLPPNASIIRGLLAARRDQDALNELAYARRMWGDSPVLQATVAWTSQRLGLSKSGTERFNLVRGGITTMRRAYPQFMAAGGEELPREVLTVVFPIAYDDLIRKYSEANGLDPYLVAALMAQESTFVADIRSSAGAVGLMQLMPSTARRYARTLKLRYSTSLLRTPESNVQIGTSYLADKIKEFGELHLALASYNAGESAVRRWMAERPGVTREEFIDDIPYPETQTYVKRILGTVEDYRRLYPKLFNTSTATR
jgi:soluble lytic murein transglycosylase